MYTQHRNVRLYYELHGDPEAPPLLMIRGLARNLLHWGELPKLLEPHFRVILFDNRGMGRSSVPSPPYFTTSMADDAAWILRCANVERAHVFGVSLGGMIAQQLAIRHPERVNRLVLGATRAGDGRGPRIPAKVILEMLGAGRLPPEQAIVKTAHLALGDAFIQEHPEVMDLWRELARDYPPTRRGFMGQLLAGATHRARQGLLKLPHQTLVITGDADRLIDAEHSEELARIIPGAELVKLRGAGHDFPTEMPEETAEQLKRFLLAP